MKYLPNFIVSRFKENVDWLDEYTDSALIYNKGEKLNSSKHEEYMVPNIGGNQSDIFHFIWKNYNNLPERMLFVQGFPFDHCKKETFDKLINNDFLTPIEDHRHIETKEFVQLISKDGIFMEYNNNWYIRPTNQTFNQSCEYTGVDHLMSQIFKDYIHLEYLTFAPGSQYLVMKKNAFLYPEEFWKSIFLFLQKKQRPLPTEAYIIERCLFLILQGKYKLNESFKL